MSLLLSETSVKLELFLPARLPNFWIISDATPTIYHTIPYTMPHRSAIFTRIALAKKLRALRDLRGSIHSASASGRACCAVGRGGKQEAARVAA